VCCVLCLLCEGIVECQVAVSPYHRAATIFTWLLQITSQGLIGSALSECMDSISYLLSYWLSHGHYNGESEKVVETDGGNHHRFMRVLKSSVSEERNSFAVKLTSSIYLYSTLANQR